MPANKLTVEEVIAATRTRKTAAQIAPPAPTPASDSLAALAAEHPNLSARTIAEMEAGRAALARR